MTFPHIIDITIFACPMFAKHPHDVPHLSLLALADWVSLLAAAAGMRKSAILAIFAISVEPVVLQAYLLFLSASSRLTWWELVLTQRALRPLPWGQLLDVWSKHWHLVRQFLELTACPVKQRAYILGSTLAQDCDGFPDTSCLSSGRINDT